MAISRKELIDTIVKYIEKRREWDTVTELSTIIREETQKHGRNSRTNRFNNNLVQEINKLYKEELN